MSRRVSAFALCITTAFCLSAGSALAAPPPGSWTGLYAGAFVGYGSGNWSGNLTKYPGSSSADADFGGNPYRTINGNGWLGGAELGFANQNNDFVWGLEGDIARSGISGTGVFDTINFGPLSMSIPQQVFHKHIQTNLDWLGTVRARFGILVQPNTLLYGTGGLAVGGTSSHQDVYFDPGNADPQLHATGSAAPSTKWGWTIGAGLEQRLDSHWSVKLEYLYANLGSVEYHYIGTHTGYPYGNMPGSVHDTDGFSPNLTVQVARVALNYKFN